MEPESNLPRQLVDEYWTMTVHLVSQRASARSHVVLVVMTMVFYCIAYLLSILGWGTHVARGGGGWIHFVDFASVYAFCVVQCVQVMKGELAASSQVWDR